MKIYIKGFKSIKDGQFVAIGRKITFLVGPNSAGKSVVMHALQKLKGESPDFELDEKFIYRNPNNDSEISGVHALGVEWESNKEKLGYFATYYSETVPNKFNSVEYPTINDSNLNITEDEFNINDTRKILNKFCDNNLLIAIDGLENVDEGAIKQPQQRGLFFSRSYDPFNNNNIINLTAVEPDAASKIAACAKWLLQFYASSINKNKSDKTNGNADEIAELQFTRIKTSLEIGAVFWNPGESKHFITYLLAGIERQRALNIFEKHNAVISKFRVRTKKRFSSDYPGKSFDVSVVSAERVLPNANDLTAHIFAKSSENIYHELMESHIAREWPEIFDPLQDSVRYANTTRLSEAVNKALSENLFTDNGYQIQVESKLLSSKKNWDAHAIDKDSYQWLSGNYSAEFFGKLNLKDSHGRLLDFKEVGSGIGYVLPVLIESFRKGNIGKIVFLQQPELHLHPALQACLTDVLIEASCDRRIIAETHSEHMILRALKRVRQTTNGTIKDPELKLEAKDVAVNYFEPLPDGSTRVHILRVSEDGDFLDRWPNGFFAERDQELFDE